MPRAVIYGPRTLNGLQMMNLQVEQPTLCLTTTIGHLRQDDQILGDIILPDDRGKYLTRCLM